jgi:hypothetical protein
MKKFSTSFILTKDHFRAQNSPSLELILCQINLIHTSFLYNPFNTIFSSISRSPKYSPLQVFRLKSCMHFSSLLYMPYFIHINPPPNLITLTVSGKKYKGGLLREHNFEIPNVHVLCKVRSSSLSFISNPTRPMISHSPPASCTHTRARARARARGPKIISKECFYPRLPSHWFQAPLTTTATSDPHSTTPDQSWNL